MAAVWLPGGVNMLLPPKPPHKTFPRADFDDQRFRQLLFEKGAEVIWQQCSLCPCSTRTNQMAVQQPDVDPFSDFWRTEQPVIACPVCNGNSYEVHSSTPTRAIVQDVRNLPKRFRPEGEYTEGTARVTLAPENKPSLGDRIVVSHSVYVVTERRVRSAETIESLRYPIASQTLKLATGDAEVRVLRMRKALPNQTAGALLVEGVDFTVTSDGKINWEDGDDEGTAPAVGSTYAVSYYANPVYRITSMPFGIRDTWVGGRTPDTFQAMPICCWAQLEYLGVQTPNGLPPVPVD